MYGFSVFLGKEPGDHFEEWLDQQLAAGFKSIFTSLHIPEEDSQLYLERLTRLGEWAQKNQVSLYADISGNALEKMGMSLKEPQKLQELGLTGLRMDYGIPMSQIAQTSREIAVALNASTLTKADLDELKREEADFDRLIAWHNYYPRPETGLGKEDFIQQNRWLKKEGLKVAAFVPGDGELRGPLYTGLPTLEKHRGQHPLAGAIELIRECSVDEVFIGDPSLSVSTLEQFQIYENKKQLLLYADLLENSARIEGIHTNRPDPARDVFRSSEGRLENAQHVRPFYTTERLIGSITVDNAKYGRYMGEVQVTYTDLPADPKVNVVGRVRKEDLPLLLQCRAGQKIDIRKQVYEEEAEVE